MADLNRRDFLGALTAGGRLAPAPAAGGPPGGLDGFYAGRLRRQT